MKKIVTRVLTVLISGIILPWNLSAQGFKTVGSELHDANNNNFIMKGINVPLAWYVNDVNSNIAALKTNTNANTLRIVVQTSTADNSWQTCVQNCINNKIIPMVELHDVTGSTSTADLQKMATWWASKAAFLTKPEIAKYILINIANEWSTWQYANPTTNVAWKETYNACVKTIRDAGIKTTLVIDAPGYGQDGAGKAILNNGLSMINADPQKNLLFSVHMYCEWANNSTLKIATDLPAIKEAGIPIIVGEFGYQHDDSKGGVCDIDESLIISTCQAKGIGWLAWSISGNSGGVEYLDLSTDFAGKNLSTWGKTIVNGTNGTKTAVTASVFTVTGVEDQQDAYGLLVSPNPVADQFKVNLPENAGSVSYEVYNNMGNSIVSGSENTNTFHVSLPESAAGVYFLKVYTAQKTYTKKLVIK